jgi:hypothetical protein
LCTFAHHFFPHYPFTLIHIVMCDLQRKRRKKCNDETWQRQYEQWRFVMMKFPSFFRLLTCCDCVFISTSTSILCIVVGKHASNMRERSFKTHTHTCGDRQVVRCGCKQKIARGHNSCSKRKIPAMCWWYQSLCKLNEISMTQTKIASKHTQSCLRSQFR